MTEQELAERVVNWLQPQHWDVFQEVKHGLGNAVIDIVAVQHGIVWAIETKTTLSFAVLAQAERHWTHRRSVAVPWARGSRARRFATRVAQMFEIGILEVRTRDVEEICPGPLIRANHQHACRLRAYLRPEMQTWAKAGNAEHSHWSPYKQTMRTARTFIQANPGCTFAHIMEHLGPAHYAAERIAKRKTRLKAAQAILRQLKDALPKRDEVRLRAERALKAK